MDQNALFRKSAIDKLASPERLDVLMQVTSPKGWAALVMMSVILGAALVWGFVGSVPTRIDGSGMLLRGEGLRQVLSEGEGVLTKLHITSNGMVEEGTLVADLSLEDVQDRVRQAQQRADDTMRDYEAARNEDQATISGTYATIRGHEEEQRQVRLQIAAAEEDLKLRRQQLKEQLITAARVQQVERDVAGLRSRLVQIDSTIQSLRSSIRGVEQRIRSRKMSADAAQSELQTVTNTADRITQVKSTVSGQVTELRKKVGDQVRRGEVLAIVAPPGAKLTAVVYVDSRVARQITVGKPVQVSPSSVKREEWGFMRGEVESISPFPVTPEAMMARVQNQSLVNELLASGSKFEVKVQLKETPGTVSGFEWSSGEGPPEKIDAGEPVMAAVVVDSRAPVTLILPMLNRWLGGA